MGLTCLGIGSFPEKELQSCRDLVNGQQERNMPFASSISFLMPSSLVGNDKVHQRVGVRDNPVLGAQSTTTITFQSAKVLAPQHLWLWFYSTRTCQIQTLELRPLPRELEPVPAPSAKDFIPDYFYGLKSK